MRYFEYGDKEIQYLTDFAGKIQNREFDLEDIWNQSDEEAIKLLSSLKGIGVWTAEMKDYAVKKASVKEKNKKVKKEKDKK